LLDLLGRLQGGALAADDDGFDLVGVLSAGAVCANARPPQSRAACVAAMETAVLWNLI
jgi:hypothetical protein